MDDADYITLPTLDHSHCECARPADYLIRPSLYVRPDPEPPGCAAYVLAGAAVGFALGLVIVSFVL